MKIVAFAAVLAVLSVAAVPASSADDGVVPDTQLVAPWVHSAGTHFADQAGNPVYLRGFNAASGWGWKKAKALGANFIRIPVYWSDLEPTPPVAGVHSWDPAVLGALDAEVQGLEQKNVNVLLDLHQTGWSPYFTKLTLDARGMPSWLYSPAYFPQPATLDGLGTAKMDFATDPAIFKYYKAYLDLIVRRYRSYPNVVGYEVYNEPQPGKLKATHDGTQALIAFQGKLLQEVRSLDPPTWRSRSTTTSTGWILPSATRPTRSSGIRRVSRRSRTPRRRTWGRRRTSCGSSTRCSRRRTSGECRFSSASGARAPTTPACSSTSARCSTPSAAGS